MDYQVSARKYRPGTFDDVIGQPQVVQALTNAVSSKRVAHAFLFSGTRGVGKTTVARILAKALNCEQGLSGQPCGSCASCTEIAQGTSVDVVEIDGASNTSVDDVREIRENAKFTPFRGMYRVYIIDEVHMLSNSAFNALLKILEEPPAHVVFIFATTELHKIPATILSRCQHYTFRRLSRGEIVGRLEMVAAQDSIQVEARSLVLLARASEGSMRDALSLFDQAVALCGTSIAHADLESLLGAVPQEHVHALLAAVRDQDGHQAVQVIARLLDHGLDLRAYCAEVVEQLRNLLVATVVGKPEDLQGLVEASADDLGQLFELAKAFSPDQLTELFRLFAQTEDSLRQSLHPRYAMEIAAIRATRWGRSDAGVPRVAAPAQTSSGISAKAPIRAGAPGSLAPAPSMSKTAPPPAVRPGSHGSSGDMRPAASGGCGAAEAPRAPATLQARGNPPPQAAKPSSGPTSPMSVARQTPESAAAPVPAVTLNWEDCLAQVAETHPSVAPFLEMGQCTGIEGNEITIAYTTTASVARAMMEKEDNLRVVREACERLAGRPVRLRVVELTEGETAGPTMSQIRAARQREEKTVLFERTRAHPLIRQTLDAFGGEITDVRRLVPEQEAQNS